MVPMIRIPFLNKLNKRKTVSIVRLNGLIASGARGGISDNALAPIFEKAFRKGNPRAVAFIINSPGGDVHAAFALIDTMKASTIPIKTVGLGLIASCGFLLFIAGTKGRRILTPNTSILSHQYSWGSAGKEHELYARVKEFELSTKRMIQHYKKCIGMNEKQIREVLLPPQDVLSLIHI